MSQYKPYSKYKDSGVDWLGQVPEHWDAQRAKYLFERKQRPVRDDDEIVTAFRDGQVTLRKNRREDGFTVALKETGYQGVRKNDLVIHAMDAFAGAVGVSDSDGKCSPVYSCCKAMSGVQSNFYGYLVRTMSTTGFIESLAKGIRERSTDFRWADFSTLALPLPTSEEQENVVAYLDRETTRIDALIEKKQRQIELLKEKRQGIITQAATKGLDPDLPMKDSGVEWLGEVPKHWKVEKLSWHFSAQKGKEAQRLTKEFCDQNPGPYPVFSGQTENKGIMGEIDTYDYDFGDEGVLFSTTVGAKAMDIKHISGKFSLSQNCMIIVPVTNKVHIIFQFYHLQPLFKRERDFIPDHMQPSFRVDNLYKFWIALPPSEEANEIVHYLNKYCGEIDNLMFKVKNSIDLLRERRTALITAAVTGQIDVRGEDVSFSQAAAS